MNKKTNKTKKTMRLTLNKFTSQFLALELQFHSSIL